MKLRTIGAVAVLALSLSGALTGCGQDEEAASKAISQSIMDSSDETFKVTQKEADCVGDGMVDEIGVDKLTDYGIITKDLKANDSIDQVKMSEGDANSAADVMGGCADIKELFTNAMGDLPEEAQTCVDKNLSEDVLHDFLKAVFMDDQEGGQQKLMSALGECIQPGS